MGSAVTAISDTRTWLETAGGRVYAITHGGDEAAFAEIARQDAELSRAVASLNLDRMSRGLQPLDADRARVAVAPRPVTEISGDAPGLVSALSRDPRWRWSWAPEPRNPAPDGVVWSGTVG